MVICDVCKEPAKYLLMINFSYQEEQSDSTTSMLKESGTLDLCKDCLENVGVLAVRQGLLDSQNKDK